MISRQIAGKTAASGDSAPPGHTFAPRKEAAATPQERTMTRGTAGRTGRLAIALGLAGISAAAGAADAALALGDGTRQPWISELRVDQQGADTDEYVEIAGDAGASLAGVWLLAIGDGGSDVGGVVEMAINLSAWSLGTSGFIVARASSFGATAFGGRTLSVASGAADVAAAVADGKQPDACERCARVAGNLDVLVGVRPLLVDAQLGDPRLSRAVPERERGVRGPGRGRDARQPQCDREPSRASCSPSCHGAFLRRGRCFLARGEDMGEGCCGRGNGVFSGDFREFAAPGA